MKTKTLDKDAAMREARRELDHWGEQIGLLRRTLGRHAEDARVGLERQLEDLEARRETLTRRVQEASKEVAAGAKQAGEDLGGALSEFRESAARAYEAITR